ncbi:MAG: alginate lyase family protein [Candidatus Eremiobacteraeota bacterium]|nr:alginate lyase family protein [Candidatus Eremiobacteraeota bacterium]
MKKQSSSQKVDPVRRIWRKIHPHLRLIYRRFKEWYCGGYSWNSFRKNFSLSGDGKKWLEHFRDRRYPAFFFNPRFPDRIISKLNKISPLLAPAYIKDADEILEHTFDLLGSGPRNLGKKIDWHKDFKTGTRWNPSVHFTKQPVIKGDGSDVKVPWELSRFSFLPLLGKAYWFTKDEKYAEEFVSLVSDWIDENPVPYGINWVCPMDIGIRAVNWIWGFHFFLYSDAITPDFMEKFIHSLWAHGHHIRANLEKDRITSNHYTADLLGLAYIGLCFPEFRQSKEWADFSLNELYTQILRQVYPDGVNYEASTSYHRMVAEFYLSAGILAKLNRWELPDEYWKRLLRMLEYTLHYTRPDGCAPQLGDNDDGRLHFLSKPFGSFMGPKKSESVRQKEFADHRHLLMIGGKLFRRPDMEKAAMGWEEEAIWLLDTFESAQELPPLGWDDLTIPQESTLPATKSFPYGGYYFLRQGDKYMFIDCKRYDNRAPTVHIHNNRLGFELYAGDRAFIIDPGSYIYTPDPVMRNLFRSTSMHNTAVIDDEEQNPFVPGSLFELPQLAKVNILSWKSSRERDLLEAEHTGYERLDNPVTHIRQVYFDKIRGFWVLRDRFEGKGTHRISIGFHFAPLDIKIVEDKPAWVYTRDPGTKLALYPLDDTWRCVLEDGWVSYRYGEKIKAPVIRFKYNGIIPVVFSCILYPFEKEIDKTTLDLALREFWKLHPQTVREKKYR